MSFLFLFVFVGLLGGLAIEKSLRQTSIKNKLFFIFSTSIPAGWTICSITLFASLLSVPSNALPASIVACWIILLFLLIDFILITFKKNHVSINAPTEKIPKKSLLSILEKTISLLAIAFLIWTLYTTLASYFSYAAYNPFGKWDSRYFWIPKAKWILLDSKNYLSLFPNIQGGITHPSYPLFFPCVLAWSWSAFAYESMLLPHLIVLSFYLSCVSLTIWKVGQKTPFYIAILSGVFALKLIAPFEWAAALYADTILAFFISISIFLLINFFETKKHSLLSLSSFFAGCAAWTKNEGFLFVVAFLAITLLAFRKTKPYWATTRIAIKKIAFGASIPVVCSLAVKIICLFRGAKETTKFQTLSGALENFTMGFDKLAVFATNIFQKSLEAADLISLFVFAGFIFILTAYKEKSSYKDEKILLTAFFFMIVGYSAVILATPIQTLAWQIDTTSNRLLCHMTFIAVAFSFQTANNLLKNRQ